MEAFPVALKSFPLLSLLSRHVLQESWAGVEGSGVEFSSLVYTHMFLLLQEGRQIF